MNEINNGGYYKTRNYTIYAPTGPLILLLQWNVGAHGRLERNNEYIKLFLKMAGNLTL
jgi:hypothetical protein